MTEPSSIPLPLMLKMCVYSWRDRYGQFGFYKNIYFFGCVWPGMQDLHRFMWHPSLQGTDAGSVVAAHGVLVPQPGIEHASPALQGRDLTTEPPGKSPGWFVSFFFLIKIRLYIQVQA